jgi:hypothetical protein
MPTVLLFWFPVFFVRFQVLMTVCMKMAISGTVHHVVWVITVMMEAVSSSEMSLSIFQTT